MDGRRREHLPQAGGLDQRLRARAPTGAADAHDSLRKVLGYVHARIVEDACVRIPVGRGDVGADGSIADQAIREQIASAVATLAKRVRERGEEGEL